MTKPINKILLYSFEQFMELMCFCDESDLISVTFGPRFISFLVYSIKFSNDDRLKANIAMFIYLFRNNMKWTEVAKINEYKVKNNIWPNYDFINKFDYIITCKYLLKIRYNIKNKNEYYDAITTYLDMIITERNKRDLYHSKNRNLYKQWLFDKSSFIVD